MSAPTGWTGYLAPEGFENDLREELGEVALAHGRLLFALGQQCERLGDWAHTRRLLQVVGRVLAGMDNRLRIEGHTDGLKFGNGPAGYGNWELSSERANAARRRRQSVARVLSRR